LKSLAEGISRQLRAWANSLQNSDIKGQRYLTEETRQIAQNARRSKAFMEQLRRIVDEGRSSRRDGDDHDPPDSERGPSS
jgi:hypothetical protein